MPCRRDNLHYNVIPKKESRANQQVAEYIKQEHADECGIVYCATQADTVEMAYVLKEHGILATFTMLVWKEMSVCKMLHCF